MTSQNDLIECCRDIIVEKITKTFKILEDETADSSHSEQMQIGIRYVDLESHAAREEFVVFAKVIYLAGVSLAEAVLRVLEKLCLSLNDLRGVGNNGGSDISGTCNCVRLLQLLAVYAHYYSTCLNLASEKAYGCKVQAVRNMIGIAEETAKFARDSPKLISFLEETIQQIIGEALVKANGLYHSIMTFQFILALDVIVHSRLLRSPKLDLGEAEYMAKTSVSNRKLPKRIELQYENTLVKNIKGLIPTYLERINHEKIMETAKFYTSDMPGSVIKLGAIETTMVPATNLHPNMKRLLMLHLTVPVTSCTGE
ncbi:hypothetical protein PR048_032275 [Dryococelus australis]|uniref:DUF4371 domain-containing protein n=1 Tax=Dryococelus australis TaxID=614101 RepID=A0ABQ9G2Y9_9NEOP|nr:hypothetical protein PR048_032275 [Dryococelus australis]